VQFRDLYRGKEDQFEERWFNSSPDCRFESGTSPAHVKFYLSLSGKAEGAVVWPLKGGRGTDV
jgi:hypothetical protein